MSKKGKGLGKFIIGASVGAALGMLFAPKKGSELRADLKNKMDELIDKAKNIDVDEVKDYVNKKVTEIRVELADLDKEKALKIAKKKAKEVENKCEDLVKYTIEKGTPVLEKTAKELKKKAASVIREVLNKLEEE
ncbi:MAG: YtxH domain-containing protein [Bacilli bacterium]